MKECSACDRRFYSYIKLKKIEYGDEELYFCEDCIEILKRFESYGINSDRFKYIEWERAE